MGRHRARLTSNPTPMHRGFPSLCNIHHRLHSYRHGPSYARCQHCYAMRLGAHSLARQICADRIPDVAKSGRPLRHKRKLDHYELAQSKPCQKTSSDAKFAAMTQSTVETLLLSNSGLMLCHANEGPSHENQEPPCRQRGGTIQPYLLHAKHK